MSKGYILVEEVSETCEHCEFFNCGFCKAICNDKNKDGIHLVKMVQKSEQTKVIL